MLQNPGDPIAENVGRELPVVDPVGTLDYIHVLHVDDEPDVASVAAEFVQREDERIEVETESNVDQAMGRLQSNSIDCVVSDYDMPRQNGIEFLETVRDEHPDLPFILYTGKGSEEVASKAISTGVTEYLQKETGTSQYAVLANRITNAVEQHQSRQALEESQNRLSLFIDQSPLGVIEWDESFNVQRMNETAEEVLGYSESEIVNESWETLVPESDHEQVARVFSNLLDGPGGYHSINENVRKDGSRITCEWHNRTVVDADGSPVAIFSQFQDITHREARERELKRHRDLLEYTEQLAATGGWEADVQTGHQRWTDGTYAIHDLDPDGDFDPTVDAGVNFYHPDDQATIDQAVDRCMNKGESYEVELRLVTAENNLRWVRASGEAIEEDGDIVKIRGAIQDINDLKTREQKLEQQNSRLDEFVNIVSHDLRNPLSVARGRLELARTDGEASDFDAVARAHDRMEELIEELLELAKAGTDAPNIQEVELDRVVRRCTRHLDSRDSTVVNVENLTLHADRKQLDLMVGNLIGNALEHGGPGVTITIGSLTNGWYIEDDGPGIPEADRQKIFDSGFTTKTDGTGFGLDIVNRVVQAHGWSIHVTTSESGGARFEITGVEFAD